MGERVERVGGALERVTGERDAHRLEADRVNVVSLVEHDRSARAAQLAAHLFGNARVEQVIVAVHDYVRVLQLHRVARKQQSPQLLLNLNLHLNSALLRCANNAMRSTYGVAGDEVGTPSALEAELAQVIEAVHAGRDECVPSLLVERL